MSRPRTDSVCVIEVVLCQDLSNASNQITGRKRGAVAVCGRVLYR